MNETDSTYGLLSHIPDHVPDDALAAVEAVAVATWQADARRKGYTTLDAPTATIHRALFPQYIDDPDGGEPIKLPDRAIRVAGRVRLPHDTTTPAGRS